MEERFNKIIKTHWKQMVHSCYFYRGMSLQNLNVESAIVLDPMNSPFVSVVPVFLEYCDWLTRLIGFGLECEINDFYIEPLHKVLGWTMRDLKNPGIDFTTNYADAASYAFNYAGSQLKHNLKLIINSIYKYEDHECFNKIDKQKFFEMTNKIQLFLESDRKVQHQPIVVKVRRSCAAFEHEYVNELNVGTYDFFYKRVKMEIVANNILESGKIAFFLHQKSQVPNFNIRLVKSLSKGDIEEVIKL